MNWFDYIRGYDDGQQDRRETATEERNIFISLLVLIINTILLALKVLYFLVNVLIKLMLSMYRLL